ncbi:glycosyltransferase family 2 protein [Candidatus Microgenomates bacterium]|nr:glycosyltransferase family 2 protein [Candidatus Microgenomates bacterium]
MSGEKLFLLKMADLSIIIVSYNTKDLLLECLASIKKWTKGISYEVIVVDNASSDGSMAAIRNLKFKIYNLKLIENLDNLGFAAANNQGIKIAKGKYILLLNSDTKLTENSLAKMLDWMEKHSQVGIASCMLKNPDGSVQATGGFFPNLPRLFLWATLLDDIPGVGDLVGSYHPHRDSNFYREERGLDWVTGAFFLIRREVINKVGLLDEDFFLYVEELEYCWRVKKAGWNIAYTPITSIIHYGGASGTRSGTIYGEIKGLKLLYQKHFPFWQRLILRLLLLIGSLLRIIIFTIARPTRAKIYVGALGKI